MSHKRNTSGLRSNAVKKKEVAIKNTDEAIKRLLKKKDTINFNTVSEEAGVSKAWLYKETAVCERIKRLRDKTSNQKSVTVNNGTKASDASKNSLITTLKTKVKELERENIELKKQLEIVYSRLHDLSS